MNKTTDISPIKIKRRYTKHGKWGTTEHTIWKTMIQRCVNPKNNGYSRYGGRGITVCERWMDLNNFIADIGMRPSKEYSIDRINNDGNYEPGNCRWATAIEQANNRRRNGKEPSGCLFLSLNGISKTSAHWARELKINPKTIRSRKTLLGWSDEDCLLGKKRA